MLHIGFSELDISLDGYQSIKNNKKIENTQIKDLSKPQGRLPVRIGLGIGVPTGFQLGCPAIRVELMRLLLELVYDRKGGIGQY